jgi:hypothetical protein
MRDSDLEPTLEADRKAGNGFLNQSTLQVESSLMFSTCRSSTLQAGLVTISVVSMLKHSSSKLT